MKLIHFKPKWSFPKFNEENRMVNIMDIYIYIYIPMEYF